MIVDAICYAIVGIPLLLLNMLGSFTLEIPRGVFDGLHEITYALGYVLPMAGLIPILYISFSVNAFQIVWATVLRIKSFIPTMGS